MDRAAAISRIGSQCAACAPTNWLGSTRLPATVLGIGTADGTSGIFINYRRTLNREHAHRLQNELQRHFGRRGVFLDAALSGREQVPDTRTPQCRSRSNRTCGV